MQARATVHITNGMRYSARAGSALWTAVNLTYTADAAEGLVAWLTSKAAIYTSRIIVTLPSGTVSRGNADLTLPMGLFLVLQGQGMAEAGGTTLDLERNNLNIGGMLGEGGRIEFRNMRVCNVHPAADGLLLCFAVIPFAACCLLRVEYGTLHVAVALGVAWVPSSLKNAAL